MIERGRVITIRASEEEVAMLHALADQEGVSVSDFLRLFIRRTYAQTFGKKSPKKS